MNEESNETKEPAAMVRHGAAAVKIYEVKADTTATGVAYKFRVPGQRSVTRAKLDVAKREAKKALQLVTQGAADATSVTVSDLSELAALRRMAEELGFPTVAAMQEWAAAKKLAGPALLKVAQEHADAIADGKHERVTHAEAWKRFIAAMDDLGRKGTRTYASKAKLLTTALGAEIMLDTFTSKTIEDGLKTVAHPATRNELLKRLGTMMRWAQRKKLFPAQRAIPTDGIDRAQEPDRDPGIVTPLQLKRCLEFIRRSHPHYLAALSLAALAGVRSDEIHGKRSDKEVPRSTMPRQRWSHIHIEPQCAEGTCGHFTVSVAKKNTPAYRTPPITAQLAAWLVLCPRTDGDDYVCIAGAMERVRELIRHADADLGFERVEIEVAGEKVMVNDLPENTFRHTWISACLPIDGIVKTADWAGNSPQEIERSYRVPMPKSVAKLYGEIMPD